MKEQQIEEIMLTIPQKIVAYNGDPKGQHLYGEQRLQIAEVLYNAGYRKVPKGSFICSGSETNLDIEVCNNCEMQQANELFERDKEIERLQKENEALKRVDNRVAFCKAYDQIRAENKCLKAEKGNAVKEFAEKVKMLFYYEFDELIPSIMSDKIDELLQEYENGSKT